MDWLEQELKQSLARKEPPPDFAERVIRNAGRRRNSVILFHSRWLAAAAALVMMIGSAAAWREHQGNVAKEQVMLAFRIAAVKVNHIQSQIQESAR